MAPANYFVALWPLLDNEEKERTSKMGKAQAIEFSSTVMYLLSFVVPRLSREAIQEHYSAIYAKLPSAMVRFLAAAPFVRAGIILIRAVLSAFSSDDWAEKPSLLEIYTLLLELATDARPKVRKGAQEALVAVVEAMAFGGDHPARRSTIAFLVRVIEKSSRKSPEEILHIAPFLRIVLSALLPEEVASLARPLLKTTTWGNNHLSITVWNALGVYFERIRDGDAQDNRAHLEQVEAARKFLVGAVPNLGVAELVPSWLRCFCRATLARDHLERAPDSLIAEEYLKVVLELLLCPEALVLQAVEEALRNTYQLVRSAQTATLILDGLGRWLRVKDGPQVPYVLRSAADFSQEAAVDVLPVAADFVKLLATMHDSKQAKHAALIEQALQKFVARSGPTAILDLIPLNLEVPKGAANGTPRAWLLPILRDAVSHTSLAYFLDELLPMADRLAAKSAAFAEAQKGHDAKVYLVIVHQIWATLGAYMTFPLDFAAVFPRLAPHLGKQLNASVEVRPLICNALTGFVHRCLSLQDDPEMAAGGELCGRARADLDLLAQFASHFLPILFNIYGITDPSQRDYILKTIEAFLRIAPGQTAATFLDKLLAHLRPQNPADELVAFLELCTVLVGATSPEERPAYLVKTLETVLALIGKKVTNLAVQKRAYRVLGDLLSWDDCSPDWDKLEQALTASYGSPSRGLDSAVKKGRFRLLLKICPRITDAQLHWIPIFLPEVVLGVKEASLDARLEAFQLIVAFARRMARGGTISAAASRGMLASDTKASLHEYMTMLVAGLASATPYMMSASIMALASVVFEMRLSIGGELLNILLGDIISILHSPSREVVKSALGFIKVALVALKPSSPRILSSLSKELMGGDANDAEDNDDDDNDEEGEHGTTKGAAGAMVEMADAPGAIEQHLPELIAGLLIWCNEHHQQFKIKVRHLIERLIRQFGFEAVWRHTPAEHHKLLTNIRRRRERAKRKKEEGASANGAADEEELDTTVDRHQKLEALTLAALSKSTTVTRLAGKGAGKASSPQQTFESAFHDSESELDSEEDEGEEDQYRMAADSILCDIAKIQDDDEGALEAVLSKKLSLANAFSKRVEKKSNKRARRGDAEDDDDQEDDAHVRLDEQGQLVVHEEEDEGEMMSASDSEGDDERRGGGKGTVRLAKGRSLPPPGRAAKRHRQSDSKRKSDKFEPYSYLPMTRGGKKGKAAAGRGKSAGPKFYMKRR